jgi:hypothetical protein
LLLWKVWTLEWLETPFTKEEIDKIIADLPINKSPGLNVFKWWIYEEILPIISQVFYDFCEAFFEWNICLRSINVSYIILVPKIDSPLGVGVYRPISLLNSSVKFITKSLSQRLQPVILSLIHSNQNGFIESRIIHDYLAWAF